MDSDYNSPENNHFKSGRLLSLIILHIITAASVLFYPNSSFGQDTLRNDGNVSLSLQTGYFMPQNTTGGSYSSTDGGFQIRPSLHIRLSNDVTGLIEFHHSTHKEHYDFKRKTATINMRFLNLGVRIYPKSDSRFYLKTELSYPLDDGFPIIVLPWFIGGAGNDIRITRNLYFFGEAEIQTSVLLGFQISFSLTAGLKFNLF